MANKKISEFDEALALVDNAFIPIIQGNPLDDYKISKNNLIESLVPIPCISNITINTTVDYILDISFAWTNNNATNSLTVNTANLISLN